MIHREAMGNERRGAHMRVDRLQYEYLEHML